MCVLLSIRQNDREPLDKCGTQSENKMKKYVWGILLGCFVGAITAFSILIFISPMGGSRMETSLLPYIIGPSLIGGLLSQSLFFHFYTVSRD